MIRNIRDLTLRFGDWGPGYLVENEDAAFGAVTLRPGDTFANHFHEHHTESFFVIEGEAELWLDRATVQRLSDGDFVQCTPQVQHYLRNVSDAPFTAFFIKSPGISGDKVDAPWEPEREVPAAPAATQE
ncbi:cupin domain-containing protein [Humidisolicoccus flavus]|uniref:cupin domain-containing protein n=1 Tax=Humidisolicoccus flavus TaxID=3111414 RepID=UPI0032478486